MNHKRALTIGLLATAIVGLGACAITFNKYKKAEKTNAIDYQADTIENNIFSFTGNPQNYTSVTFSGETGIGEYTAPESAEPGDVVIPGYSLTYSYKITNDHLAKIQPTYTLGYVEGKEINTSFQMPVRDLATTIERVDTINIWQTKWWIERLSPTNVNIYLGITYYVTGNNFFDEFYDEINYNYLLQMGYHMTTWTAPDYNEYNIARIQYIQNTINSAITYSSYSYQTGLSEGTTYGEVVPVRQMMLDVLSMPFTFITNAFNVTLWEGTEYAFNVSNFIKGLIAIATILFIIKLFTSGMGVIGNFTDNRQTNKPKVTKQTNERQITRHEKKIEKQMNDGFRRG